jgi:hypothetical protein
MESLLAAEFEVFPIAIRPKSGPEAGFPARKQHCVTQRRYSRQFGAHGSPGPLQAETVPDKGIEEVAKDSREVVIWADLREDKMINLA